MKAIYIYINTLHLNTEKDYAYKIFFSVNGSNIRNNILLLVFGILELSELAVITDGVMYGCDEGWKVIINQ